MTTKRNRSLPNFTIRGKRKAKAAPPPACPVVRPKMRQRDRELFEKTQNVLRDVMARLRPADYLEDAALDEQVRDLFTDIDNTLAAAKS